MCAGVWVTVCVDNFNDGAASAACRQLGYCDVAASGYRNATKWVSYTWAVFFSSFISRFTVNQTAYIVYIVW